MRQEAIQFKQERLCGARVPTAELARHLSRRVPCPGTTIPRNCRVSTASGPAGLVRQRGGGLGFVAAGPISNLPHPSQSFLICLNDNSRRMRNLSQMSTRLCACEAPRYCAHAARFRYGFLDIGEPDPAGPGWPLDRICGKKLRSWPAFCCGRPTNQNKHKTWRLRAAILQSQSNRRAARRPGEQSPARDQHPPSYHSLCGTDETSLPTCRAKVLVRHLPLWRAYPVQR